jgi:hypothetical protein
LKGAASRAERAAQADAHIADAAKFASEPADRSGPPRFVAEMELAPPLLRDLDETLTARADLMDGREIEREVLGRWPELVGLDAVDEADGDGDARSVDRSPLTLRNLLG